MQFQSTRPVWGATAASSTGCRIPSHFNPRTPCGVRRESGHRWSWLCYFNPRTPCGARLAGEGIYTRAEAISIHAPRAGCDAADVIKRCGLVVFQSTRPVWGATDRAFLPCHFGGISIHAPRAGCDKVHAPRPRRSRDRLRRPERSENVPGADALCSGDVLRRGRHFLKKKLERPQAARTA